MSDKFLNYQYLVSLIRYKQPQSRATSCNKGIWSGRWREQGMEKVAHPNQYYGRQGEEEEETSGRRNI